MTDLPLRVTGRIVIPAAELEWRFDPSGGPGGQHANRTSSRAELRFDLGASPSVPDTLKRQMLQQLGSRAAKGVVAVTVDQSRSQWRNRVLARQRMSALLRDAIRVPRRRIPTGPSRAAQRRQIDRKRRRGEIKRLRRRPEID